MFSNVKGIWGFVGGTLTLVALYLVLVNALGAEKVIGALGGTYNTLLRTLQGR